MYALLDIMIFVLCSSPREGQMPGCFLAHLSEAAAASTVSVPSIPASVISDEELNELLGAKDERLDRGIFPPPVDFKMAPPAQSAGPHYFVPENSKPHPNPDPLIEIAANGLNNVNGDIKIAHSDYEKNHGPYRMVGHRSSLKVRLLVMPCLQIEKSDSQ